MSLFYVIEGVVNNKIIKSLFTILFASPSFRGLPQNEEEKHENVPANVNKEEDTRLCAMELTDELQDCSQIPFNIFSCELYYFMWNLP